MILNTTRSFPVFENNPSGRLWSRPGLARENSDWIETHADKLPTRFAALKESEIAELAG